MTPALPSLRVLLLAGLVLALPACGRRGALEPPPDPAAPAAVSQAGPGDDDEVVVPAASFGAARKRPRGLVIPKEPFVLDPLL